jgi:Mu-like prophage I protein
MGNAYGHWIDLFGMTFADNEGTWLQALPLGTYEHPVYGTLKVTPERIQRFAQNVQMSVRGQDLDIDYDHKAETSIAAGWVTGAEARADGLWINVMWTPAARQKLQDREYRYFSPEFMDEWTHPKTGVTHKDVLFGGAITNRPFLKDILPINLSEMVGDHNMGDTKTGAGGTPPTDAENMVGMAKLLGLTGQVTSADILTAAAKKLAEGQQQSPTTQNITLSVPAPQAPAPVQPQTVRLGEQEFQLVPVAAPSGGQQIQAPTTVGQQVQAPTVPLAPGQLLQPVVLDERLRGDPVALGDVVRQQNEKIALLASAHKLAEAQAFVVTLSGGDGSIGLSPVVRDLAIELMVKAPAALSETVEKLLRTVAAGNATVALGELGRSRTAGAGTVVQQFTQAVDKLRKDNEGMTYADAVERLATSDPRLANAYREATMAGEE